MTQPQDSLICVGMITSVHGVRGVMRVKSFTEDPMDIFNFTPLTDHKGQKKFPIEFSSQSKGLFLVTMTGVSNREDAEMLKGTKLYTSREQLPEIEEEDSFYYSDLIGLKIRHHSNNDDIGEVIAIHNFGAGDIIEMRPFTGGKTVMVPFTQQVIPEISLQEGLIKIDPPIGLFDDDEPKEQEKS